MLNFNIQSDVVLNVLDHTQGTLENPNAMFKDMGEYLVPAHQERFKTSTAPDGSKWLPNSEMTYLNILDAKHSNKDGTLNKKGINRVMSKRTLIGDGNLMNSIHYQISGDLLLVGSNLVYAAIHQFGGTIKPKSKKNLSWNVGGVSIFAKQVVIPKREYLGISVADEAELMNIVEDHVLL